jgi:hypothetical protein
VAAVTTVPLTTEGRHKTQLAKGADWSAGKQRIDEFELGVTGFGQLVFELDI